MAKQKEGNKKSHEAQKEKQHKSRAKPTNKPGKANEVCGLRFLEEWGLMNCVS
jgi:hypothetical protein